MLRFVNAVELAVQERNWFAALVCALALPDICGWLEKPTQPTGARFMDWCQRFLVPRYTHPVGVESKPHVFLSADDCYALRCAVLHEGSDNTTRQRARRALERFIFVEPPTTGMIHCNQVNKALQLQVDVFCSDICDGVRDWERSVLIGSPEVQGRLTELATIRPVGSGLLF